MRSDIPWVDLTDRYEEALKLIERALELKPDEHYVVDSMGWVLYRLGRLEEAEKYLRQALSLGMTLRLLPISARCFGR